MTSTLAALCRGRALGGLPDAAAAETSALVRCLPEADAAGRSDGGKPSGTLARVPEAPGAGALGPWAAAAAEPGPLLPLLPADAASLLETLARPSSRAVLAKPLQCCWYGRASRPPRAVQHTVCRRDICMLLQRMPARAVRLS